ncbi:hypothetical protein N2Q23_25010, partial [Escherichia coli]|uniref:hypothetical protein n=1 Tax=Escherichia coli TaxID=562 RepID=UPI0021B3596C
MVNDRRARNRALAPAVYSRPVFRRAACCCTATIPSIIIADIAKRYCPNGRLWRARRHGTIVRQPRQPPPATF